MKYIKSFLVLVILAFGLQLNAQIGYQVSLLNSATGEPRANETVSVEVEITNSENTIICSETKSATTNEFGVLSLQIGNANTFQNVDWSKLPLYVSATVDGIMVGKSQILNVPVAEAAKTMVNIDLGLICRKWSCIIDCYNNVCVSLELSIRADNTFTISLIESDTEGTCSGIYFLHGNVIFLCAKTANGYTAFMPSSVVYDSNAIHGNFADLGSRILH